MGDTKWLALAIFLLSCLVTYIWCLLDKVSSGLSYEKKKVTVLKRDQLTLDESVGDFKLDTEKRFTLVKDRLNKLHQDRDELFVTSKRSSNRLDTHLGRIHVLENYNRLSTVSVSMGIVKTRLEKLEAGVKVPIKKSKVTKRKKS